MLSLREEEKNKRAYICLLNLLVLLFELIMREKMVETYREENVTLEATKTVV